VDQLFSILTQSFKSSDIKTLEDLLEKIETSGIVPKPEVEILDYCWDWKEFALQNLCKEELRNHASYHCFNLKKDGSARLRGKRYLFDKEWFPPTGIRLLQEETNFYDVGTAAFRLEKLQFDKIFQHLQRFLSTLPLTEKLAVGSSWNRLREKLEKIADNKDALVKMKLLAISTQAARSAHLPEHFTHLEQDENVPDLQGELFPESLDEGDFNEDMQEGLDVLVYSKVKKGRPWCGRIIKIVDSHKFLIHWFARAKGDRNTFVASYNGDKSPYTSELETGTVILWNFSSKIDQSSFHVNSFFLLKFKEEYIVHDNSEMTS
jgi:hypothetical protein